MIKKIQKKTPLISVVLKNKVKKGLNFSVSN